MLFQALLQPALILHSPGQLSVKGASTLPSADAWTAIYCRYLQCSLACQHLVFEREIKPDPLDIHKSDWF